MKDREPSFKRVPRPGRKKPTGPSSSGPAPQPWPPHEGRGPGEADDLHTRIVIPRQGRSVPGQESVADVELREVRYGATTRGPYLRVVPRQRRFIKASPGHFEATQLASRPRGQVERVLAGARAFVIGRPLAASQSIHERLTKIKALAVLGSDPLSSSAYATEETLIILVTAGAGALIYSLPIALVIAAVMVVVGTSYRQTQKAYPSGGGAYIVAHDNFGMLPGLVAGAALIVDYVLLVSVSVAAGVAAITSAVPDLLDWSVPLSVAMIGVFTLGNLRGIRESGTLFAAPTYFFVVMMGAVVAVGLIKVLIGDAPGSLAHAAAPRERLWPRTESPCG